MKTFSKFQYAKLLDDTANQIVEAGIQLTKEFAELKGKSTEEYVAHKESFTESFMEYCTKKAGYVFNSLDTIKNPQIVKDDTFKKTFNAVIAQIITPVAPAVVSNRYMELADVIQIGFGDTGRFPIRSNDLFYVSDVAEGVQFGGLQRLYNDEITVNPTPKQIRYDIPWLTVSHL